MVSVDRCLNPDTARTVCEAAKNIASGFRLALLWGVARQDAKISPKNCKKCGPTSQAKRLLCLHGTDESDYDGFHAAVLEQQPENGLP